MIKSSLYVDIALTDLGFLCQWQRLYTRSNECHCMFLYAQHDARLGNDKFVCLSVCLYVTRRHCVKTASRVIQLFTTWYTAASFWISEPKHCHLPSCVKFKLGTEICTHRPITQHIPASLKICPQMIWITNGHSHRQSIDSCHFQWPWVTSNGGTPGVSITWVEPYEFSYRLTYIDRVGKVVAF